MARLFVTEPIPAAGVLGRVQKDAADFETGLFSAQVKKGYNQPSYLREWIRGIVEVARGAARIDVVIGSPTGDRDDEALVILRARDFADLAHELESRAVVEPRQQEH